MSSGSRITVRLAAERVFVRVLTEGRVTTMELRLEEVLRLRSHLDEAIAAIEAGLSVVPSLAGLLTTLPARSPAS